METYTFFYTIICLWIRDARPNECRLEQWCEKQHSDAENLDVEICFAYFIRFVAAISLFLCQFFCAHNAHKSNTIKSELISTALATARTALLRCNRELCTLQAMIKRKAHRKKGNQLCRLRVGQKLRQAAINSCQPIVRRKKERKKEKPTTERARLCYKAM